MSNRYLIEFQQPPVAADLAQMLALAKKLNASVVEAPEFSKISKKRSFPGIEKTPGVCGGDARVAGTRIPVWSLVIWKNLGMSDEKLLTEFETLSPAGLKNAWAYYASNKEEVDSQVAENESNGLAQHPNQKVLNGTQPPVLNFGLKKFPTNLDAFAVTPVFLNALAEIFEDEPSAEEICEMLRP